MKGYIYICKMQYEGKSYYKIGRSLDLGKRELALKTANPFLKIVAKKESFNHEKEEGEIQRSIKNYHFTLEWYELEDNQYQTVFNTFQFQEYSEEERNKNISLAHINVRKLASGQYYHTFKKPKKLKNGTIVHRWYYYYIDATGKQVQKACRGCKNRQQAENYIRELGTPT